MTEPEQQETDKVKDRLWAMLKFVQARDLAAYELGGKLQAFTVALYHELEDLLRFLSVSSPLGDSLASGPEIEPLPWGGKACTFRWDGARITLIPFEKMALLDETKTTDLLGERDGQWAGRLVFFHRPLDKEETGIPIADVFVFEDGHWVSHGLQLSSGEISDPQGIRLFALRFLETLAYQSTWHHRGLDETRFDMLSPQLDEGIKGELGFLSLRQRHDDEDGT